MAVTRLTEIGVRPALLIDASGRYPAANKGSVAMSDYDSPGDESQDDGYFDGDGDHPENSKRGRGEPLQGSFQVSHHTARLPESIGSGVFANALMVLAGQLEVILDFVQRLHEPNRVVARVVLSPTVARQFVATLKQNIERYEETFGELPPLPKPLKRQNRDESNPSSEIAAANPPDAGSAAPGVPAAGGIVGAGINEPGPPRSLPPIEDIYDDLRLDEEMLSGRYANAVIVRHSPAEFAFDFITRFVPNSCVSSRVIVAAPNMRSMVQSLEASVMPKQ